MLPFDIPIDVGREEAQRQAAEELAKAKYPQMPQNVRDLLNGVYEWLGELLRNILAGPINGGTVNIVWLIFAVIVVGGIVLIVWKVGLPRLNRHRDAEVGLDDATSPEQYRDLAEEAAARRDWRLAVRERFRAMVKELEVRTVVERRPARTAYETAASAATELPDARASLEHSAWLFNETVYGRRRATDADYVAMTQAEAVVLSVADRGLASLAREETAE